MKNKRSASAPTIPISAGGTWRSGRYICCNPVSTRRSFGWLGITPREHSTAGRQRLGKISRQGDEGLRQSLVLGATAVIQHVERRIKAQRVSRTDSPWLLQLLARKPEKVAAVALANKMARIVWAMLVSGELYRQPQAV